MNDQQKIELLRKALVDAEARMTRARMILTDKNPRPECNWGMLDTTSVILPALSATATPPAPADGDRREGDAIGYLSEPSLQTLEAEGFAMLEKAADETATIPLYPHPRAESPSEGEMLAFAVDHGWPHKWNTSAGVKWGYPMRQASADSPLDAIRAAMKEAGS